MEVILGIVCFVVLLVVVHGMAKESGKEGKKLAALLEMSLRR